MNIIVSFSYTYDLYGFHQLWCRCSLKIQIMKKEKSDSIRIKTNSFFIKVIYLVFFILFGAIISCSNKEDHIYDIIHIQGDGEIMNLSKSLFIYAIEADSGSSTSLLIEKDDMINIGEHLLYGLRSDEGVYRLESNDSLLYINGALSSIFISKDQNVLPIINKLSDSEILALRSVSFGDTINEAYLPILDKIASVHPNIGLRFENGPHASILEKFNPTWLFIGELSEEDLPLLLPELFI